MATNLNNISSEFELTDDTRMINDNQLRKLNTGSKMYLFRITYLIVENT